MSRHRRILKASETAAAARCPRRQLEQCVLLFEAFMTKVQVIEEQIKQLSPGELSELREWLAEHDWAEWDRQIERDSASGKLDRLFATARADHAAGKSTKL
jgi:hypothetical protein